MQSFGAEGISQDQPLAQFWAGLRTLRYADVRGAVGVVGTRTLADVPTARDPMRCTFSRLASKSSSACP